METRLYIPQAPVAPEPQPEPKQISGEDLTFFNEGGIAVTKTRFIVHGETYALANVSSVRGIKIPAKSGDLAVGVGLGGGLLLLGLGCIGEDLRVAAGLAILGLVLLVVSIVAIRRRKPTYLIMLNTAGGEIKTCGNNDYAYMKLILDALNRAIVARG
jgi:hypothetical protein